MFKHSIKNCKQLAHGRGKCHFFHLASSTETQVKFTDYRIVSCSNQGSHIQHGSDMCSATPDDSSPMEGATVTIKGRYPCKSCNLPPIKSSHLRQLGNQSCRKDWTYSRCTLKQAILFSPNGIILDFLSIHGRYQQVPD